MDWHGRLQLCYPEPVCVWNMDSGLIGLYGFYAVCQVYGQLPSLVTPRHASALFQRYRTPSDPSLQWSVGNILITLRFMVVADS